MRRSPACAAAASPLPADLERGLEVAEIGFRRGHHRQVTQPQARKAVLLAERHAAAELRMCGVHAAALVVGVAEPAERARNVLGNRRLLGILERAAVRAQACIQLAARKVQVAAQRPQLRHQSRIGLGRRGLLGVLERDERFVVTVDDAQARRETEPAARPLAGRLCEVDALAERRDCIVGSATRQADPAYPGERRTEIGCRAGELAARWAWASARSSRDARSSSIAARRYAAGADGILGRGEVIGLEPRRASLEPGRRATMELAPRGTQQRLVHGVADQRVREPALVSLGGDEPGVLEPARPVARLRKHMPQRAERKPRAEHRGGVQTTLQIRGKAADPGQQETADRSGQGRLAGLRGPEELVEKERVAGGLLQALLQHRRGQAPVTRGEIARFVIGERREVERAHRATAGAGAPAGSSRIAFYAGRHGEQHGQRRDRGGQVRELRDFHGIGPVDVLDDDQERRAPCRCLDEPEQHAGAAAFAARRIHGGQR